MINATVLHPCWANCTYCTSIETNYCSFMNLIIAVLFHCSHILYCNSAHACERSSRGIGRIECPKFIIHRKTRPALANKTSMVQIIIGKEREDGQHSCFRLLRVINAKIRDCWFLTVGDLALLPTRGWIKLTPGSSLSSWSRDDWWYFRPDCWCWLGFRRV
jgi:hypothetical protein